MQGGTGKASQGFGLILTFLCYILGLLQGLYWKQRLGTDVTRHWVRAGGGEGLQATKIHEPSPLLTGTAQTLTISVLEGAGTCALLAGAVSDGAQGGAALSCSSAVLCKAKSREVCIQGVLLLPAGGERLLRSWPILHGAQSCSQGAGDFKDAGINQGLARVCLWGV